ncbi:hypothetical protein GWR56_00900 [Mucilaginibacter sp. 14171R-50]|nr:hypothetical protein [Mucilaginibacter sp. 14171R-50]QHS54176.1 hypothetical protein GWR56_00900 [Mucilaginibacter sp. 14171R-50]
MCRYANVQTAKNHLIARSDSGAVITGTLANFSIEDCHATLAMTLN